MPAPLSSPLEMIRHYLDERSIWFREAFQAGKDSLSLCKQHADSIDSMITSLTRDLMSSQPHLSIMALGGYGRKEMGLFSDIDLLFLCEKLPDEEVRSLVNALFYPFWDCKVEIGGATRTLDDCQRVIGEDVRALTAMMDARLVVGDQALAKKLQVLIFHHFQRRSSRRDFILKKIKEQRERLHRFGDSISVLQPHVKEGDGGLRHYQTAEWVARTLWGEARGRALFKDRKEAYRFLWRIRHALHLIAQRRLDRLEDSLQKEVASMLGFSNESGIPLTHQLLRHYYQSASSIHILNEEVMEQALDKTDPWRWVKRLRKRSIVPGVFRTAERRLAGSADVLKKSPLQQLKFFAIAHQRRLDVEMTTRALLRELRGRVDDELRGCENVRFLWRSMFAQPVFLDRTLTTMHECGHLEEWFPELKSIRYRVELSGHHLYTVDAHSLRALAELSSIAHKKGSVYRELEAPHLVVLATLFHDVGKGERGDHTEIGAKMAEGIAFRLGYAAEDVRDVGFLVRSHQLMTRLAFHRDVLDPNLIHRFALTMSSQRMLRMLYLVTVCDLRAVAPGIWTEWKGGLLAELYARTTSHLKSLESQSDPHAEEAQQKKEALYRLTGDTFSRVHLDAYLASLPSRYSYVFPAETIARHLEMVEESKQRGSFIELRQQHEMRLTELTVVTHDAPGLFAQIAGVLTAQSVNIIDARLFTTRDGIAVDVFRFTDLLNQPLTEPTFEQKLRSDLEEILQGRRDLEALVAPHLKKRLLSSLTRSHDINVEIDNDVSAVETVIEVHAPDLRGLLYMLTKLFFDLQLSIEWARITTHVDRAVDVFYVRDVGGGKVTSPDRIARICREIEELLT